MAHYRPPVYDRPEFCGVPTFMRLPLTTNLDGVDFSVIGVPFDTGGSWRVGCRFGPRAIRSISGLLWPYHIRRNMDLFDYVSGTDFGDLPVIPGYHEHSYRQITDALVPIVEKGVAPILLGGDHSITLPALRAVSRVHGPVSLIHFDSHPDTWPTYFDQPYWHGSPIINALEEGLIIGEASTQIGIRGGFESPEALEQAQRMGIRQFFADEIHEEGWPRVLAETISRAAQHPIYLTFDIDFLDPSVAPGTGTPEIGGFASHEAIRVLRNLENLNFVAFDMVEVLPAYDTAEITALAAATLVYEFIGLLAEKRRGG